MISFALPLFMGNLFQQLYNTADSLIVGNFLGSNALAAVSGAGSILFLMIGFFIGLSMGSNVVIARYIGAKDREGTQIAVHTTVALGIVTSVILTLMGVFLAPQILLLVDTPAEVMPDAVLYFRVYFSGATAFVMYNMLTGIMRAAGDSRHPLYYLVISSVVNVILDLVLIGGFSYGVGAAALATVVSQIVSMALALKRLLTIDEMYRIDLRLIRFHVPTLVKIIRIGFPSGIQNSVIAIANVVVQANINYFGEMSMAGAGAYSRIEGFAFLPITSFTMAITTFVSQNLGAKKYDRARSGGRFGVLCCMVIAELVGIFIFFLAPVLIAAFDRTPGVIYYGVLRSRTCALFYFLLAYSHAMSAVLRGAGRSIAPLIVLLVFWCVIRVTILAGTNALYGHEIMVVNSVYPVTWTLSSIAFMLYYRRFDFTKTAI